MAVYLIDKTGVIGKNPKKLRKDNGRQLIVAKYGSNPLFIFKSRRQKPELVLDEFSDYVLGGNN